MSKYHDPQLQAAFDTLVREFPKHFNRLFADELSVVVAVPFESLELLEWITLKADGNRRYYIPCGELLNKINSSR